MAQTDAPNYRNAGPASTQTCGVCRYAAAGNRCTLYDFTFDPDYTCDSWRPNIPAVRSRQQELQQASKAATDKYARALILRAASGMGRGTVTPALAMRLVGAIKEYYAHGPGGLFSPAGLKKTIAYAMLGPDVETKPGGKRPGPSVKNPELYEKLLKRGYSKAQAAAIANAAAKASRKSAGGFYVFKDTAGRDRWVSVSSNAYRDKDREIVSQRALHLAVAIADRTKERGPLRWWHVPGLDIGECDFQMVHGRMLVESGMFKSERITERVKTAAPRLQMSIGFRHPPTEPAAGVFDNIVIFERSLVPAGRAANPFTSLHVKERETMATKDEKLAAFRALLGDEANAILAGVEVTDKAAQTAGVAFKERTAEELAAMPAMELLDYALALAAKEAAEPEPDPEPEPAAQAQEPAAQKDTGDVLTVKEFRHEMAELANSIRSWISQAVTEKDSAPDPAVTAVEQQIADLSAKLKEAEEQLAALTDEQPRATKAGYRASQHSEPVDDPQATAEAQADAQKAARNGQPHYYGEFEEIAEKMIQAPWTPSQ